MKYRHLLLVVAVLALMYAFVFIRLNWVLNFYPTYGDSDIYSGSAVAIACIAAWVVLEVISLRSATRGLVCNCGYALRGVRCPECGEPIGADQRPAAGPTSNQDGAGG